MKNPVRGLHLKLYRCGGDPPEPKPAKRCKDCIEIERTWNWYDKYCLKCSRGCLKFPFA